VKQLSPNSASRAYGLSRDNEGNLYIAGTFRGTSDFNPDALGEFPITYTSANYNDVFITKLDCDGDFIRAQSFGGDNEDFISGLMMNQSNGMFVLSGSFVGTCDFDPTSNTNVLTSAGSEYSYVARFVQRAAINETIEAIGCGSYDYNGTIYIQSGSNEQILISASGCDSIVTLNLIVHGDSYSNVQLYAIDEIEYNGQVYNAEGDYVQTTENIFGGDSLIYINVDIMQTSFDVQDNNGALSVGQQGNSYQWVDCKNNGNPTAGATNATFSPTASGSFAVIVYGNNGSVTSECIDFVYISMNESEAIDFTAYPNPCQNQLFVRTNARVYQFIEVVDLCVRVVIRGNVVIGNNELDLTEAPTGTYFLRLIGERETTRICVKAF